MTMTNAILKVREGEFVWIEPPHYGANTVRYQTPTGKWKEKTIEITVSRRFNPAWKRLGITK